MESARRLDGSPDPLIRGRHVVVSRWSSAAGAWAPGSAGMRGRLAPAWAPPPPEGGAMRIGRNVEVRPLGGAVGCLAMIAFSVLASVVLTVLVRALS